MSLLQILSFEIGSALKSEASSLLAEAKAEARDTMEFMIVNEGQRSVYESYILPQFIDNCQAPIEDGWTDVDAGDYIDFMGDIVEECNTIMGDAYEAAQELNDAADVASLSSDISE